MVAKIRKGKSTAKINCFVAGTPTHVVQGSESRAVGNVVMAISFGVFVTSEFVDRKRRNRNEAWSPNDLDDPGIGTALDELEPDDQFAAESIPECDLYQDTVDSLFAESYEQEQFESQVATLVQPTRKTGTLARLQPHTDGQECPSYDSSLMYDGTPMPSISKPSAVATASESRRTVKKASSDMTWMRSISILALCASLLFGLFAIVPDSSGPTVSTKPIEQVRVGQRVLVDAPDDALAADFARLTGTELTWDQADGSWSLEADVDPLREIQQATSQQIEKAEYRLVKLKAHSVWADGTVDTINVETLQPWQWIHHHEVRVQGYAPMPIDALEMGLPEDLTGKVIDILPCPPLRAGPGRLVLTTVDHLNKDVIELTLLNSDGDPETLRPTGTHKFYSITRGEWLSASQLARGEHLDGINGKITVADVKRLPGTHRVYNMTVQGEHLYRVAECGVLVHNQKCTDLVANKNGIISEIGISGSSKKIDVTKTKSVVQRNKDKMEEVRRLGREGEKGINKNTKHVDSISGKKKFRIPDEMTDDTLTEIKNVKHLNFSTQLQDSLHYAIMEGKQMFLRVRKSTRLSGPLQRAIDEGWIIVEYLD